MLNGEAKKGKRGIGEKREIIGHISFAISYLSFQSARSET